MKTLLHKWTVVVLCLLMLNGCYNSVVRFWNNGYMSEKRSKAYDECFDEVRSQDPVMAKIHKSQSELAEFLRRVRPCMERKGY